MKYNHGKFLNCHPKQDFNSLTCTLLLAITGLSSFNLDLSSFLTVAEDFISNFDDIVFGALDWTWTTETTFFSTDFWSFDTWILLGLIFASIFVTIGFVSMTLFDVISFTGLVSVKNNK